MIFEIVQYGFNCNAVKILFGLMLITSIVWYKRLNRQVSYYRPKFHKSPTKNGNTNQDDD